MTHFEFYQSFPRERVSRLQAAKIFPRHTMRNLAIYEQFLALCTQTSAGVQGRHSILRQPTRMDFYTQLADDNALSEDHIRHIIALMETPI